MLKAVRSSLLRVVLVFVAGSALLFGGLAQPAAAQGTLSGSMFIVDADWPDADDIGNRAIKPGTVTSTVFSWEASGSGCVDKVRGEWRVEIEDTALPGWQRAEVRATLWEGSSCATTDFDGSEFRTYWLPLNSTTTKTIRVDNEMEPDSGDYIIFTFVIKIGPGSL